MGVGGNNAAAGGLKAADVVFVVADEDDVLGINLVLLTPVAWLARVHRSKRWGCPHR